MVHPTGNRPRHDPTPEEIAEMTAAIREGWSAAEHERRAGVQQRPWEAPQVANHSTLGEAKSDTLSVFDGCRGS